MAFTYGSRVTVSQRDRDAYLAVAIELAKRGGAATLPYFRSDLMVSNKSADGGFDPVTAADRAAESIIRNGITGLYPSHGIFGEEHGFQPGDGLTWVIDPIDGTRAFVTGMLHWGVLLALFDGVAPVLGVMYQPFTEELFIGTRDGAEYRRGSLRRSLTARRCESLGAAVLASTGPQFFAAPDEKVAFNALRSQVRFTRFGGDCYLYCMLAMGFIDIAAEAGLQAYDVQALMPIIHGAGGVITTWDGDDASMGGRVVAAGDPRVHAAALTVLQNGIAEHST
jgi:histidinol-phosphatase